MRNGKFIKGCDRFASGSVLLTLLTGLGFLCPITASAQNKVDDVTFDLVANPKFVDCLRRSSYEEVRAKATVIRGKQNDTLILDLDGIKPELDFDLFTVQRSSLLGENIPDPSFKGSFGLAWYQSDIHVGKRTDDGHVRIKTILLDQISALILIVLWDRPTHFT